MSFGCGAGGTGGYKNTSDHNDPIGDENTILKTYAKVRTICVQEFDKEISGQREQLQQVSNKLISAKQLLRVLRKKCVADYYAPSMRKTVVGSDCGYLKPMHPAMRNIDEYIAIPQRCGNGGDDAQQTLQHVVTSVKTEDNMTEPIAVSQQQLHEQQSSKKTKISIIVGNTSKYLGCTQKLNSQQQQPTSLSSMSYKWIVYVQSRDNMALLQSCVKKMRFILDPSYRPNDIVDVCQPPFQVSRCGWGEFTVRIRIYFHDELEQKPIEIMHNLRLDETLSGVHKMGAETMIEIMLPQKLFATNFESTNADNNHGHNDINSNANHNHHRQQRENRTAPQQRRPTQMSLLKPNFALVNNHNKANECKIKFLIPDHDYVRPYIISEIEEFEQKQQNMLSEQPQEAHQPNAFEEKIAAAYYSVNTFYRIEFAEVRDAVEYLLKCDDVVYADTQFHTIISDVQNEWLRAKQIRRLLKEHKILRYDAALNDSLWTTREILQFARIHGYSKGGDRKCFKKQHQESSRNLAKPLMNSHAKDVDLCQLGISSSAEISQWLTAVRRHPSMTSKARNSCKIVCIDNEDDSDADDNIVDDSCDSITFEAIRNIDNKNNFLQHEIDFVMLHLKSVIEKNCAFMSSSSPAVICTLASALRSFLRSLLKFAVIRCDNEVATHRRLLPADICQALCARSDFDFLTNCYMGTSTHDQQCVQIKTEKN